MKRLLVVTALSCFALQGQNLDWSKAQGYVGGGFTIPQAGLGQRHDMGWGFLAGGGMRVSPKVSLNVEYSFNKLDYSRSTFTSGVPTATYKGGTELHGFLSYLMICTATGRPYRVLGYKGKQVRDNIHSFDLVEAFIEFIRAPRSGEVYNIGGSRHSNCSMLEAIALSEEISGRKLTRSYEETNRVGDHIWWISDVRKFQKHYPAWKFRYGLREILEEIHRAISAPAKVTVSQ